MNLTILFLSMFAGLLQQAATKHLDVPPEENAAVATALTAVNLGVEVTNYVAEGRFAAYTVPDSSGTRHDLFLYDANPSSTQLIGTDSGGYNFFFVDELLYWIRSEVSVDLNGDGDTSDTVLQVYDTVSGMNQNSAWAVGTVRADGLIAFSLSEAGVDLNGDGDTTDLVYYLLDDEFQLLGGSYAVAGGVPFLVEGNLAAVSVWEFGQNVDLNGDGDKSDTIVHVYEPSANGFVNTGLDAVSTQIRGGRLFARVSGAFGPGLHVYDPGTQAFFDPQLATFGWPVAVQSVFAVAIREAVNPDLNGDGDRFDIVLHLWDPATGAKQNLGIATGFDVPAVSGDVLIASLPERDQGGEDLNGDGDDGDTVLFLHDLTTGRSRILGYDLGGSLPLVGGAVAVVPVDEAGSALDLNGNGLSWEQTYFLYDPASGLFENLRQGVSSLGQSASSAGNRFAVPFREVARDLNGDGDVNGDTVVMVYEAGQWLSTGVTSFNHSLGEDLLAIEVLELWEGADLNGDGDTSDRLLHVVDLR